MKKGIFLTKALNYLWFSLYGCTEVKLQYKLTPLCTIRQCRLPGLYCTMTALYRVGPDARGFVLYWGCTIDYPGRGTYVYALDSINFHCSSRNYSQHLGLNGYYFFHRGQEEDYYYQFPQFYLDRKHGKAGNRGKSQRVADRELAKWAHEQFSSFWWSFAYLSTPDFPQI